MDRAEAFEKMLADVLAQERAEKEQLDALRAQGREKTALFKQLMANRLVLTRIIALFRDYGLVD